MVWIHNNPRVSEYLRGLGEGTIPLTHEGLQDLSSWRTPAHLQDLLIDCGVLPAVDRQILLCQRWAQRRIAGQRDPDAARLLRQFITWHQLPRMHAAARRGPLTPYSRNYAAAQVNSAIGFLDWLDARDQALSGLTQADLDAWHARSTQSKCTRIVMFLKWAITTGHMSTLALPRLQKSSREPLGQQQRLHLLRRALTDQQTPARVRVAACVVLLYAQPIVRLVRLTLDDVTTTDGQVLLRLGDPVTPVPEPFGELLACYRRERGNMNTASNADSRWLFPGGRAGQPIAPNGLARQLRAFGVPTNQARTAAFRQLVLQAPAPVIASALGLPRTNRPPAPHQRRRHMGPLHQRPITRARPAGRFRARAVSGQLRFPTGGQLVGS